MALPGRGLIGSYDIFEIDVVGQTAGDGLTIIALGALEGHAGDGLADQGGRFSVRLVLS